MQFNTKQLLLILAILLLSCGNQSTTKNKLAKAAESIENRNIKYDPAYFRIGYPMGDVPANKGVCSDVIIRAYRKIGIDLQQIVHEDMLANFEKYPHMWGMNRTDSNIDHRRVYNLMKFFERQNANLPITKNKADYLPGDIVCWNLGGNLTHIGLVTGKKSILSGNYLIIHNIGGGQVIEDILFSHRIIGHYRY
jgi:uncharacterized protein